MLSNIKNEDNSFERTFTKRKSFTTSEEANDILEIGTLHLQRLNTQCQETRLEITGLKYDCECRESEIEKLDKEREKEESYALKYISISQDQALQDSVKAHKDALSILHKIFVEEVSIQKQ
ncbi:1719_t:CDS:2 [Funneliformis geosporum]|uniref:13486_t:CDS:1 n=1 Tax=Funneliformis geosporum TaxID=1117311 RepID=A0A9W4SEI4_9GLOM|nr:13486_t:CDS:2 [Funneliformis geosporum]CAI2166334.1 1719_t:CDS:2 [Funneliformis geosporum]